METDIWSGTPSGPRELLRAYISVGDSPRRLEVELLSVHREGIACAVRHPARFDGAVGEQHDVALVFLHLAPRVERVVKLRLERRVETEQQTIFDFKFVQGDALQALGSPELAVAFERRGGIRVPVEGTITLTLKGVALETGRLVDIASGGLAADMSPSFEQAMVGRDLVECLFRLPGESEMLSVRGQIRHRSLRRDGSVRFGVMFIATDDRRHQAARDAIVAWIASMQAAMNPTAES
jgi:hypothetical protein